jgi:uncharacterized protein YbbK (DUF523 family)
MEQQIITEKIHLGVSACCAGAPVRWNRRGWDRVKALEQEAHEFHWHPVCPECMSGMSVPRDPIAIAGASGDDVWTGKARVRGSGKDFSQDMMDGCQICLDVLKKAGCKAYVFMEGSPSCGVYRTTLKDRRLGKPPGVFGSMLLKEGFFLIPALDLDSPIRWWDWRRRLHAFTWLEKQEITTAAELQKVWSVLKFLCQELLQQEARKTGKEIAAVKKSEIVEYGKKLKKFWLDVLRRPSTQPRIEQSLWKHYCHFKKVLGEENEMISKPKTPRAKRRIVKEISLMERRAFDTGILFGASPVIYRDAGRVKNRDEKLMSE